MSAAIFITLVVFSYAANALAQTQPLATGTSFDPPIARLVFGLLLCVFLAYTAAHVLRNIRKNGRRAPNFSTMLFGVNGKTTTKISIVETHRLSATNDVSLIAFDGKEYLVLVGNHSFHVLKENDAVSNVDLAKDESI